MHESYMSRTAELQRRMADADIGLAVLADPDSIYYLSAYWGYAGLESGRPTLLLVPRSGDCALITPLMEGEMCGSMTWIEDVREWMDGLDGEWMAPLARILDSHKAGTVAIETNQIPPLIGACVRSELAGADLADISAVLGEMRMIKSPEEIEILRQCGQVAVAMVEAAEEVIGEDVPEYEVALAVTAGGTRKAAGFLTGEGLDRFFTPTVHNLQILQSGHDTSMVHRRSTVRRLRWGDPVYLCFCGIITFKNYRPGFDREFFFGSVTDEQAGIYETALRAQGAALEAIRPGVPAEEVHFAADAVYRGAGFAPTYRTGRAIGCSVIERPELKAGDTTPLRPGMTFAVDGGITVPGEFGARVGDSIVVTEAGFEYLTPYPKDLKVL